MLENQFIEISSLNLANASARKAFPVVLEHYVYALFYNIGSSYTATAIAIVDKDNTVILSQNLSEDAGWLTCLGDEGYLDGAPDEIGIGDTFFLRLTRTRNGVTSYLYSQPLIRVSNDGFVRIDYYCTDNALGFPFASVNVGLSETSFLSVYLPIYLHSPQNVQKDETYVKSDGTVITLYAKYYKEWECVTDFISEEMHDKIVAAFSCDNVFIDGKRFTKSDNYQVDWDNYDLDCDGVTKLAKATFKVRENITQRNSNY